MVKHPQTLFEHVTYDLDDIFDCRHVYPNVAVWTGTAYYPHLRGLVTVRIPEGGTIRLGEFEERTRMSHAVWMDFPNNRRGRLLKWLFTTVFDGKAKLYDHTNKELVFFKERIESAVPESPHPTNESV